MKRLPDISSDLRIRLEGAVEQLEYVVSFAEGRLIERRPDTIPSLIARWPALEAAALDVARHTELAALSAAFAAARADLERSAMHECELLGLVPDGDVVTQLAAISRARVSVATPAPTVVASQPSMAAFFGTYAAGASVCGLIGLFEPMLFLPALGLCSVSAVALLSWTTAKRWKVTTTHVVMTRPRETAIALADVTEIVAQGTKVVVKTRTQQLALAHPHPTALARVLTLLWRVPPSSHQVTVKTARGRTVVADAQGVAVLRGEEWKKSGIHFAHFEPRALASACDEAYWPAAKLALIDGQYHLPDGDTFVIRVPGDYLVAARRR